MKTGSRARTAVFRAVLLFTLGALASGARAEVVGRVLLAAGDAVAVRDGRDVRLNYGSQIEHADILRTGAASSLQVRFVDESLISLRENSQLGIESYRFAGKQDGSERAIFRLLKGGFRTVTGLIGQLNRQNYEVRTPTSTIGIRGTDYAVRDCVGDCGAGVKDGLYGSVLGMASGTNKVAVANNAGESVFGKDEHFYVADANSPVQQLLQPPTWVAVKPQGKGQAAQQGGSGSGSETAGGGSGVQGESRPATFGEPPAPIALSTVYVVTQDSAQTGPFVGVNGLAVAGGDILFGTFLSSLAVSGSGTSEKLTSFISSVEEPDVGTFSVSGTEGSAGSDMVGAVTGINAHFGRWINGTLSVSGGGEAGSVTPDTGVHWIYGYQIADPSTFAPRTGAFQFNRVAGTAFTDNLGNIATSQSFGPMWVEFLHRKGFIDSVSYNVGGVSYAFRGIELFFDPTPGAQGLGFFGTSEDYPDQGFGKCVGGACGTGSPAGIAVSGGFAGTAGDHAGVSMGTFSPAGHTSSVQLYQCPTCASSAVGTPLAALAFAYNNFDPGGPGNFTSAEVSIKQAPYMVFSGSSLTAFDSYPNVASLGGGSNTDVGSLGPINGAFGRWNGGTVTSVSQNPTAIVPFTPGSGIHWLYGDVAHPEAVFARTGLVNFGWVAGTNPTDAFGGVGAFSPTGNIAVNFTNQTAAITAQWTTPGYTWNLNGFPLVLRNDGLDVRLQTPLGGPLQDHPSTSCTGSPSCMSPTPIDFADVRGTFMGSTANHIGTAISTSHGMAGSTSSVQVFGCPGKPGGC
jgi:hypothetical protein